MTSSKHGIVIGKFYPPHKGHHHLIRYAAQHSEQVTVVVMAAAFESIPLEDRLAWLRAEHATDPNVTFVGSRCELPVNLASDTVWAGQIACIRAAVHSTTLVPVDTVYTSEQYGVRLADGFEAEHVMVDNTRTAVPISATAIRNDLAGNWESLAPATKAGLTTRIVVLGSESTGTTTLSTDLTKHYATRNGVWAKTTWIPEYGREYTIRKVMDTPGSSIHNIKWTSEDFAAIAAEQQRQEDLAATRGGPLLICDTDALATRVWERRYVDARSMAAQHAVPVLPPRALYLLTDPAGIPFEQDGYRDGEHVRAEMTSWFIEELTRSDQPFALLTGTHEDRMALAIEMIDRLLTERATFRIPLG